MLGVALLAVGLLIGEFRSKSSMAVIDAAPWVLTELAVERGLESAGLHEGAVDRRQIMEPKPTDNVENNVDASAELLANAAFWKRLGEEYEQPLIVTGSILFTRATRHRRVKEEAEKSLDARSRRAVATATRFIEEPGYAVALTLMLIDGRTGSILHTARFREEMFFDVKQDIPALSAYFELMDRVVPSFVAGLSEHKHLGVRVLLQ
jgi:hypothetical protein